MPLDADLLKLLPTLIQTGSFGVLVFMLLWIFVKHLPRLEDRMEKRDTAFLGALDKQHQDHAVEVKAVGERFDQGVARIEGKLDGIRYRGNGT